MSKKNSSPWRKGSPLPAAPATTTEIDPAATEELPAAPSVVADLSPMSPAQLVANRANAQLSTGPRSQAGLAKSSQNAIKSALTGRTVLLPTDDVDEYAALLESCKGDLKPVGQAECELVQIIVDCFWRRQRIQALEFALYAHGHEQFHDAFPDCPEEERYTKTLLQTSMVYEKQFRNYQIQEARIDRKLAKSMAEVRELQAKREAAQKASEDLPKSGPVSPLRATHCKPGVIPPPTPSQPPVAKVLIENGFVFSNSHETLHSEYSAGCPDPSIDPSIEPKAA
jgi:hypothetical protein